jgi:hypothetical protein
MLHFPSASSSLSVCLKQFSSKNRREGAGGRGMGAMSWRRFGTVLILCSYSRLRNSQSKNEIVNDII